MKLLCYEFQDLDARVFKLFKESVDTLVELLCACMDEIFAHAGDSVAAGVPVSREVWGGVRAQGSVGRWARLAGRSCWQDREARAGLCTLSPMLYGAITGSHFRCPPPTAQLV